VQTPIVVSIPVVESLPTRTLFSSCTVQGDIPLPSSSETPSTTIITTSVLIQSTPPPSTVVVGTTTTLSDGSVVQTSVTVVSTPSPTAIYVPTTSVVSPTQGNPSQGNGTNVASIVGGVLGGFIGLVVIIGSLWWICRRRRRWDDIFEKDENDDVWASSTTQRRPRGRGLDSSAEPRPYQYGLVGRAVPPAAAGETLKLSRYGSASERSGAHSRQTSLSATPLLQGSRSSRPSTSASIHTQLGPRVRSTAGSIEAEPRSLSMVSYSSNTGALLDREQSMPALLDNWTPNTDDLTAHDPLNRAGSPVPSAEQRILQIVNDGPSPTDTVAGGARHGRTTSEADIIMHTDGGPVAELDVPPAYSR